MKNPPRHPTYPLNHLRDLLIEVTDRYSTQVALKSKVGGTYRSLTYSDLRQRVVELATAYFELGLQTGDRVAVLSENRTEWVLTYLAAVSIGLVIVPIDKDLTPREISHILNFSKPRILVCSSGHLEWLSDNRSKLDSVEKLISMEQEGSDADLFFPEALDKGRDALSRGSRSFEKAQVSPEDLAATIFTSGTTGTSKGVMLTHGNLTANIMAISQYVLIRKGTLLSVLPLHHTYECTAGFLVALYQGCTICHAESLLRIPDNLQETQATVMLGVPVLFESFYRRIKKAIEEKGARRFWVAKGLAAASERLFKVNLRPRLFKKVHQRLGGHLQLLISGGAAMDAGVAKGFRELGIIFIQGYGMTEASPIISVNRVDHLKDESVGLPLPGVEVKLIDSEILVRGPSVMKGYYLNEAATREALENGWLHTGDLGYFDQEGFLYINGRKKSVIVTPGGKNVYPEEVESLLNQSPYILESLVWGGPEDEPSKVLIQAIIVPDPERFDSEFGPDRYDDTAVHELIGAEVKKYCKHLANYKRIRRFVLRAEEFEKTTTRKIKRYLYTGKPQQVVAD